MLTGTVGMLMNNMLTGSLSDENPEAKLKEEYRRSINKGRKRRICVWALRAFWYILHPASSLSLNAPLVSGLSLRFLKSKKTHTL
ncbi:hypothetical protein CEXT_503621 [Caerostris extrusa]|uniref:Uncharacterized protein n=1 Tax=Caerostris extrusa TaxID=172846 RepID=A0AAV4P702_CAEEX|nr:hypothetical protein CEXT_503621 [Caerostris extrusa]